MKLTKQEARAHRAAAALIAADRTLTREEREYVLDHWHEGAEHDQSAEGAFASPRELARHVAMEIGSTHSNMRVLDLCAGIGRLAAAVHAHTLGDVVLTCVERNAGYVRVGRAAVPSARWCLADVKDVDQWHDGARHHVVMANPPFGRSSGALKLPHGKYRGSCPEYRFVEFCARFADYGVFVLPQSLVPWRLSGQRHFERVACPEAARFTHDTGIVLSPNCGIDTSEWRGLWRGAAPQVEIVCVDYTHDA